MRIIAFLLTWVLLAGAATLAAQPAQDFQSVFAVEKKNLGIKGSNPYFPLTPGNQLSYRHSKDTDTLTVLRETKVIDGVETLIVEDREMKNGQIVEVTRDYYAIDSTTDDVYYMGEDVDVYRNGKIVGHEGAWISGVNGAKFGLMMPGSPKTGQKFYQEQAPGVGMDRAEILSAGESRHPGRKLRELRPRGGDQREGKGAPRSQVVRARRRAGQRLRDGPGQIRQAVSSPGGPRDRWTTQAEE